MLSSPLLLCAALLLHHLLPSLAVTAAADASSSLSKEESAQDRSPPASPPLPQLLVVDGEETWYARKPQSLRSTSSPSYASPPHHQQQKQKRNLKKGGKDEVKNNVKKAKNNKNENKKECDKKKKKNRKLEQDIPYESWFDLWDKACKGICTFYPSKKVCTMLRCEVYDGYDTVVTIDQVFDDLTDLVDNAKSKKVCGEFKKACIIGDCTTDECHFYSEWCTTNTNQNYSPSDKMGCPCSGSTPKECKESGTCIAEWQCCPEETCESGCGTCCPTGEDCCGNGQCCKNGCNEDGDGCNEECVNGYLENGNCCPGTECTVGGGSEGAATCCPNYYQSVCNTETGACDVRCSIFPCQGKDETCCKDSGKCIGPNDCCPEEKCGADVNGFGGKCCVDGIEKCHNKECKLDCAFEPNQEHCCEGTATPKWCDIKKACIPEGACCCDSTQKCCSKDGSCVEKGKCCPGINCADSDYCCEDPDTQCWSMGGEGGGAYCIPRGTPKCNMIVDCGKRHPGLQYGEWPCCIGFCGACPS